MVLLSNIVDVAKLAILRRLLLNIKFLDFRFTVSLFGPDFLTGILLICINLLLSYSAA